MKNEVVITGLGVICSQAMSPRQLFDRVGKKQSSVRNHPRFAACGLPNPACAYIDDEIWRQLADEQARHFSRNLGPQARLAVHAACQAVSESGLELASVARKGLFVGCNKYTFTERQFLDLSRHFNPATQQVELDNYLWQEKHETASYFHKRQDMAALALAEHFGITDAIMTHGDACAAGGVAIGSGYQHIAHGELEVALVGATETMSNYFPILGFGVLGALCQQQSARPETISRPFDKDRSGFVMGEGSGFLVLESLDHARKRGANILGKISGFARKAEAWRITASPRDGSQYARCIQAALQDAGLAADGIDHINAHGTSTQQNDSVEGTAIKLIYGSRAETLPVTSNKSALGHSLAASGAIEAVLSVMSLQQQVVLPTLNFCEGDADTSNLNIVQAADTARVRHIASHSFGFGGENCVLILSQF